MQSNRPIVGIAQTGSDLAPYNRHHLVLAQRVKDGIREAGGIPLEFPLHPIQETGKRPTTELDRNLAYLGLVEVLTIGCDKTMPACLMAAATVNLPRHRAIGQADAQWLVQGRAHRFRQIVWKARQMLAAGEIAYKGFVA